MRNNRKQPQNGSTWSKMVENGAMSQVWVRLVKLIKRHFRPETNFLCESFYLGAFLKKKHTSCTYSGSIPAQADFQLGDNPMASDGEADLGIRGREHREETNTPQSKKNEELQRQTLTGNLGVKKLPYCICVYGKKPHNLPQIPCNAPSGENRTFRRLLPNTHQGLTKTLRHL